MTDTGMHWDIYPYPWLYEDKIEKKTDTYSIQYCIF